MKRTALIDGDTVIYEAGRAAEEIVKWDEDTISWYADLKKAEARFITLITEIAEGMNAHRIVVALSDYNRPNWRLDVLPTYKQARNETAAKRRPLAWAHLRSFCEEQFETFIRPTLEGDDVLGILMTHPTLIEGEKVCVSIDKDMKTIPGFHCNFTKNGNEFGWEVTEIDAIRADYFHLYQTLCGDKTDGYAGCPGVGDVGARKILDPFFMPTVYDGPAVWQAVVDAFAKKGLTEDDAMVQARVARICRHWDYDFTKKEVRLWMPPK